jgi:Fe2+ or Zn2+ uptake regulation protein
MEVDRGEIERRVASLKRASARFDANLAHHHHYVCVRCGLARDFESPELGALRIPSSVQELGSIASTHVEVRGVCSRCERAQAKTAARQRPTRPKGKERSEV